jgi:hypothetical protein
MKKKRIKNRKTIPLNTKNLGDDISAYPFVEIQWLDIEGDAGWSSTKDLKREQLPTCVSKGYLLSQSKGITRIFTDYILNKDKPTFETIGNTCIIPTAVIQSIKKDYSLISSVFSFNFVFGFNYLCRTIKDRFVILQGLF